MLRNSDRKVLAALTLIEVATFAGSGDAVRAVDAFFRAFARYAYQRAASHGKFRAPGVSVTVIDGLPKRRIDRRTLRRDESATIDAIAENCGATLIRVARSGAASETVAAVIAEAFAAHAVRCRDAGSAWCMPYVFAFEVCDAESTEAATAKAWEAARRKVTS